MAITSQMSSAPSPPCPWRARRWGSFGLNVANTAATTLLAIVLARIMGVTDYGTYAVVIATVILLGLPAVMGVDRLLIRDIAVYAQQNAYGLVRGLLQTVDPADARSCPLQSA